MPHLLHLDSALDPRASSSRPVTAAFAQAWRALGPDHTVTHHDLQADPPPHLAHAALHWAAPLRTADEAAAEVDDPVQRALLDELLAADVLLVGAPMYNWSLPSTLKAWVDHVHVLGTTVPFGDRTDQPLAGRTAVVVSSRGAGYAPGGPTAGLDHTVPPLAQVLGQSFGMHVEVVTLDLTLAGRVPAMAPLAGDAEAQRVAATTRVQELARALG
ncbi:FMN-dependent NADH-azoreductase [Klenkia soli]|uniref:FMN dependent NADH:quinone oxidoreductase n=1 Tax=Klenkia soli TaxID=1052260 RepID=A0A1H0E5A7_9ACTN|nr:NAD(P)H-dependent oxidoreductase [Klenkia soli]SDN77590.1 FMN-dependent NADH-azoreductase [Klenkia soli]